MIVVPAPKPLAAPGAEPLRAAAVSLETQRAVEQFLYRQSECLDTKRWQDFIDLFADDGIYWMPADPAHASGDGVPSIFYEDRAMMTIRMKRMAHPRAWSQKTEWGLSHVVSNVVVTDAGAASGAIVCRSRFYMMEFRRDAVRNFAGSYVHRLVKAPDGYRITLQRVDMVNADAPYDYVLQAWV